MKRIAYTLLLSAATLVGACGGDKTGPDGGDGGNGGQTGGSYSVTVSGDAAATLSGKTAGFGGGVDEDGNEGFVITGGAQNGTDASFILGRLNKTRPGTGTYTIGEPAGDTDTETWVALVITGGTNGLIIGAESGTIKITKSSSSALEGSFEFTGVGVTAADPSAEKHVTVKGTFAAKPLPGASTKITSLQVLRSPVAR